MAATTMENLLLSDLLASTAAAILTFVFIDLTKNTDVIFNCIVFLFSLSIVLLGKEGIYAAYSPHTAMVSSLVDESTFPPSTSNNK